MKKLKLSDDKKKILPLYYNYVKFRKLDSSNYSFELPYSKKYMNYTNINAPHFFVSKIVDYSKID